ncbi:grasp-with-spasm system ATP-grasp peptide maturase [Aquimarina sediminis]|uniref:grasp-with-spasm system ATP-grasp peptide maturase n=1 Tax=Aquimarina sediminis TaxID=2070536 RepID=UPI000CA074A1|nr:grasp-with-spasm system ATP-grasp peptide maturase [Aquimarina sediminis]
MILIISIEQDESTIDIIKWLNHFGVKYIVLNNNNIIDSITVNVNTSEVFLNCSGTSVNFNEISSVWYRRGNFKTKENVWESNFVSDKIEDFLQKENRELFEYLHFLLGQKFSLNNYNGKKVNKLIVLTMAKDLGLTIPRTIITNKKKELNKQLQKGEFITKAINNPIGFYGDTYWLPNYTTVINKEIAKFFENTFGISQFQKNIHKTFEIRSYLLVDEFYSMAIFSQEDQKTETDFRQYNHEKPNRTIPYQLPEIIASKLKKLAKKLDLNSCSFDLIYTTSKEYVFLEVNPIGQFGMVSYPCNYNLEKKIAQKLIRYDT